MTIRRRRVIAACALVLAAVLVALAIDVRRSASALRNADLRFEQASTPGRAWTHLDQLPLGPGRTMLELGDDLAFRHAADSFRATRPSPLQRISSLRGARLRLDAERALERIARKDGDLRRKARAENLLGILAFESGNANSDAAETLRTRSIDSFRAAVRADPGDTAAKYNLELALALFGQSGIGTQGNGRGNQAATTGAVSSPPGQGY